MFYDTKRIKINASLYYKIIPQSSLGGKHGLLNSRPSLMVRKQLGMMPCNERNFCPVAAKLFMYRRQLGLLSCNG
jgi:hypothetical protein